MKFSKLSVIAMLGVAAMSSCSNDNELTSDKSEYVTSVRVTVEDFLPESPASRTSYTVDATVSISIGLMVTLSASIPWVATR